MYDHFIDNLLDELAATGDQDGQDTSQNAFRPTACSDLVSFLDDNHPKKREYAASCIRDQAALYRAPLTAAIPKLLSLLDDVNSNVRMSAASALGQLGADEAISRLLELLDDDDAGVRGQAVEALGTLRVVEVASTLASFVDDEHLALRCAAAAATGEVGAFEAVPKLISRLGRDHFLVQQPAAVSLGQLGATEAIPALLDCLNRYDHMRPYAAHAFGQLRAEETIPVLIRLLDDAYARQNASISLGQLGAKQAIPRLLDFLGESNPSVRGSAAISLALLGAREAVPRLLELLEDWDRHVQRDAAIAVGKLGATQAIPLLIELLDDSVTAVDSAVSLFRLDAPDSKQHLAATLKATYNISDRLCLLECLDQLPSTHDDCDAEAFLRYLVDAVLHPTVGLGAEWITAAATFGVFRAQCMPAIMNAIDAGDGFTDSTDVLFSIAPEITERAVARRPFGLSLSDCPKQLDTSFVRAIKRELYLAQHPKSREFLDSQKWTRRGKSNTKTRDSRLRLGICTNFVSLAAGRQVADPATTVLLRDSFVFLHGLLETVLSPEEYLVLVRRYYEGRNQEQVAKEIGVTTRTIRRREQNAVAKLRASELVKRELVLLSSSLDSSLDRSLPESRRNTT